MDAGRWGTGRSAVRWFQRELEGHLIVLRHLRCPVGVSRCIAFPFLLLYVFV